MDQLLLALDYGGTKHTVAVLREGESTWAAHARVFSPPRPDAAYDQATVLRMARELLSQVRGRLVGVGVSFGGPVDASRGLVLLSHHVPGWEMAPLAADLSREFGAPAAVDNDANVAALGEWRFGAGQGTASMLYVTISTGVGGGWVGSVVAGGRRVAVGRRVGTSHGTHSVSVGGGWAAGSRSRRPRRSPPWTSSEATPIGAARSRSRIPSPSLRTTRFDFRSDR